MAEYMNDVRCGIRTSNMSGTSATHPSGPQSNGVKLAHRRRADEPLSSHAPLDPARNGLERAFAMICCTDGSAMRSVCSSSGWVVIVFVAMRRPSLDITMVVLPAIDQLLSRIHVPREDFHQIADCVGPFTSWKQDHRVGSNRRR